MAHSDTDPIQYQNSSTPYLVFMPSYLMTGDIDNAPRIGARARAPPSAPVYRR